MTLKTILQEPLNQEELYQRVKNRYKQVEKRRGLSVKEKAGQIATLFPEIKEGLLKDAAYAMAGKVKLPGTGGGYAPVGNPPKWTENTYNTNEYIWQINRMDHWLTLLAAYTLTGDEAYGNKVVDELNNWIDVMVRPALIKGDKEAAYKNFNDINGWRSLEVGIRLHKSWPEVIENLMDTNLMTPALLEKFALSVYEQAEVLAEVCPMFFPEADHNHYVMENLGLLWAATYFPEFKQADQWKDQAVRELERCMAVQMTDDGAHIEGCPMYHNGCVRWFTLGHLIAKDFGIAFSKSYMDRLEKSLEYSIYSFRPTGKLVPWGDSKANQGAIMGGFYGYLAFDRPDCLLILEKYTDRETLLNVVKDHIWFLEDISKFAKDLEEKVKVDMPTVSWQKTTKQVAIRTDWSKGALSLFFACYSPVHTSHAHMDPMGFDFTALGKTLLADPGYYTYQDTPKRRQYKSPQWHNTLTVNKQDPYEYQSSFGYGPQKEGRILDVVTEEDLMYVIAEQESYAPVVHKRFIGIKDQSMLIILDLLENTDKNDTVQLYYHIDSVNVKISENKQEAYTEDQDVNVGIYTAGSLQGALQAGTISEDTDIERDSIRFCLEDKGGYEGVRRIYATVVVPYEGANIKELKNLKVELIDGNAVCTFELDKAHRIEWDIK